MHLPDGFLDPQTALATTALAGAGLGYALHRVRADLPPRRVPLLGLSAAFLFTAQMVNFPVAGGTSGHLIGGALVAILLGPAAAAIVVTCVLLVQCLLFADGGLLALGANVFNMGLLAPLAGGIAWRLGRRVAPGPRGRLVVAALAGWFSTVVASLACAGELASAGTVAWRIALPAMVGVHALIGLGEGLITALVVKTIAQARPDLLDEPAATPVRQRGFIGLGLLATAGLALFVAPFACPWPDGLDSVATRLGFADKASSLTPAPFADYQIPGLSSPGVATALAGLVGAAVVFGLVLLCERWLARHGATRKPTDA